MLPIPPGVRPTGLKGRYFAEMVTDGCLIALGPSVFHHLNKSSASGERTFILPVKS